MTAILYILSFAVAACWFITEVQMFKKARVLSGLLGILTIGLWAFIWGWRNREMTGQKDVMIVWSIAWVLMMFVLP